MQLTVKVRLLPTTEQATGLRETLERCNAACEWISAQAATQGVFRQFDIHRVTYYEARKLFGLSAQAAVLCISKVADAHKVGKRRKPRRFRRYSAQPYDPRILSWGEYHVSIWTLDGRIKVPFKCGEGQRELLESRVGQAKLLRTPDGKWLLAVSCKVPEEELHPAKDFLGVDMGIVNLATDSDGDNHSGDAVERVQRRYSHRRRNLQRKGTKASKRKLKRMSGQEARFRRDVNHRISKALVQKAQRTGRGLALEDLQGIRDRVTARRRQRV